MEYKKRASGEEEEEDAASSKSDGGAWGVTGNTRKGSTLMMRNELR